MNASFMNKTQSINILNNLIPILKPNAVVGRLTNNYPGYLR